MKRYDDMRPMMLEKFGESRVLGAQSGHGAWHCSFRRCPKCGYNLAVNADTGDFFCNQCKYTDVKDLSRYADLRYGGPQPKLGFTYGKGR